MSQGEPHVSNSGDQKVSNSGDQKVGNSGDQKVDRFGDRWMNIVWRKPPADSGERTRRRITVHLLPFLFFLYILAYLDRANVSVAALGMTKSPAEGGLGFTDDIIGFGGGLFFWGYWILEIPSTISVAKWGARWVFMRILVMWGLCAALCGFIGLPIMYHMFGWLPQTTAETAGVWGAVTNFVNGLPTNPAYQFYFLRFMLGFFEGGFFPTVIVFLSFWFPSKDRAKAIACFMVAIPFSGAIGMPVSGLLLDANWFSLEGWRWVLILEGVVPILAGVATFFLLPNRPSEAKWLPDHERNALQAELDDEHRKKQGHGHWAWVHHLGMVLLLTLVYFGLNVSSYGLSMFMPAIIKSQTGVGNSGATWLAGGYYLIAAIAMLFNGWHSDHTQERIWHVCIPLAVQGTGLFLAALTDNIAVLPMVILFTLVATCHYAHLPAFWPIPTMFLGAIAAASAIGFINMVGNLGGFFGPQWVGSAVSEDIKWLKAQVEQDKRGDKFLPAEAADSLQAELNNASTPQAVSEIRNAKLAQQRPPEDQLAAFEQSKKAEKHYDAIQANIEEGKKLSPERTLLTVRFLSQIALHMPVTQENSEELYALLTRGASFASGLKKLAPFPIMSAVIILLVGFFRRRAPVPAGA